MLTNYLLIKTLSLTTKWSKNKRLSQVHLKTEVVMAYHYTLHPSWG